MTGLAERMQQDRRPDWAPYRAVTHRNESPVRHRLSGFGVLAAFFLFSGITVAVSRGNAGIAERYHISSGSLLVVAWLAQGAAALFCFVLAVRWLRS